MEKWKKIKGLNGKHQISSLGRVRSFVDGNEKILKSSFMYPKGRKVEKISFTVKQKVFTFLIHRLVAEAFIPNPKKLKTVNHINLNNLDNRLSNLEWASSSENKAYSKKKSGSYTSKYKGVHFKKSVNRWIAKCSINGKKIHRHLKTEKEAALTYNELAKKLHGRFAILNEVS